MMIRAAEAVIATEALRREDAPKDRGDALAVAAFRAGLALNMLDNLVRAQPSYIGAFRQRLALKAAAAAARRIGLKEDEEQLRDAWRLRAAGSDPGPAGRLYGAWRLLVSRPLTRDAHDLRTIADAMATPWSAALAEIPLTLAGRAREAPFAAAAVIAAILAVRPDAELFAWRLADGAVARSMGWPVAVPLLMGQFHSDVFRAGRGRVRPGSDDFQRAICLALVDAAADARRLAADLTRRAERLDQIRPKLRAKGAGEAIELLINDDAVSGSLTTPNLSRFASRRLFERLAALDAIRELTGRPTFRLYGL